MFSVISFNGKADKTSGEVRFVRRREKGFPNSSVAIYFPKSFKFCELFIAHPACAMVYNAAVTLEEGKRERGREREGVKRRRASVYTGAC